LSIKVARVEEEEDAEIWEDGRRYDERQSEGDGVAAE
jgi:hypothetical protein